ncbi:MAG: phytanoyl-CoA dioxygenase family protein [Acidimicrobiales bacterium]
MGDQRATTPTDPSPTRAVTEEERVAFERDGVVRLAGIYPREWVDHLESQLTDVFDLQADRADQQRSVTGESTAGIRVDMVALAGGLRQAQPEAAVAIDGDRGAELKGRSVVETDASIWHRGMRTHNTAGPLPEIVAGLTGSAKVNFYADQLFLKEAGSRIRTPFHQDKPYFMVDGGDVAVCWVPVDRVTADNGPMGYVRGSHRWGKLFKPSDFVTDRGTFPERDGVDLTGLEVLPPISADEHDLVYIEAEPGDVIVHHWATVHGSAGNVSATATRRAASVRYACDGCTYHQRASSPEPFRFTIGLDEGDPLESADRFPIVWPRQG